MDLMLVHRFCTLPIICLILMTSTSTLKYTNVKVPGTQDKHTQLSSFACSAIALYK